MLPPKVPTALPRVAPVFAAAKASNSGHLHRPKLGHREVQFHAQVGPTAASSVTVEPEEEKPDTARRVPSAPSSGMPSPCAAPRDLDGDSSTGIRPMQASREVAPGHQTVNELPRSMLPDLSPEEQRDYDEIEEQFRRFRLRQSEVAQSAAQLLERLNARTIHVPSSVASSECGDLSSIASSEWDAQSLYSEPGSAFASCVASPAGTPPIVESPRESLRSPRQEIDARLQATDWGLNLSSKMSL